MEIMFPVEDPRLKEKVMHILEVQLRDTVKAHLLQPDGSYEKWIAGEKKPSIPRKPSVWKR